MKRRGIPTDIIQTIDKTRKTYGWTLDELARRAHMPLWKLNDILTGQRPLYAEDYFYICQGLHIDLDQCKISENADDRRQYWKSC